MGPLVASTSRKINRSAIFAAIRCLVAVGIWLRDYSGPEPSTTEQLALQSLFALYSVIIIFGGVLNHSLQENKRWILFQVLADTVFFAGLFASTGRLNSDFYLFFFLPLVIAAEHFDPHVLIPVFSFASVSFLAALCFLYIKSPENLSVAELLVNNALPRWFFFLFVIFVSSIRETYLKRETKELDAVQETAIRIFRSGDLQQKLDAILDAAINLLGAKGCKVYLKTGDSDELMLVAVKGIVSDRFKVGYILPPGKGIAHQVFASGNPIIENFYPESPYQVPELAGLFQAVVEVPLLFDKPIGVLGVFDEAKHRSFTQRDIQVLVRLAHYASVAIYYVQLFEKLGKQAEASKVLYDASGAMINASLNVTQTLDRMVEHASKLVAVFNKKPPLHTYFAFFNDKIEELHFEAAFPSSDIDILRGRVGSIKLGKNPHGIIGRAIMSGENQNVPDVTVDPDYILYDPNTRSQLAVLARGNSGIVGIISIEHSGLNAFPGELQELMEVLAIHAASAFENARLFRQNELQRETEEKLRQASVQISSCATVSEVGKCILETLHTMLPFSRATLQKIDEDRREIVATFNLGKDQIDEYLTRPVSQDRLIQRIFDQNSVLVLSQPDEEPDWELTSRTGDITSWAGIPLVYGHKRLGLITLDNVDYERYGDTEKRLLESFAANASSSFQNALLFEELNTRINDLTQTQDSLESLLEYLEDHRNLALIGLVFGETIHHAKANLGMAKTLATNISFGEYGNDSAKIRLAADKIIRYINNYLGVLNDVQKRAIEMPSPSLMNLHHTLDQVIASKKMSPDIHVIKEYHVNTSNLNAPSQLRQVFFVIIQNAIDAMQGGEGTLSVKTEEGKGEYSNYFLISISDTGKGIDAEKQAHLFEHKIISDDRRDRRGSGMGLVWARSFVRSYGGDIYFTSKPQSGTTMFVRIPQDFGKPATFIQNLT